ncbi:Transmembrane protein 184C [Triplophysa tibetana]|uniref:Transmembrane protein 184C n=1 Tax=Triplophysa tibetana TaxID=1572043 RepID=A0A5A9PMC1_9TELE|nr:Transmembrane protein 184C [Triplophysa tibetana]
MWELEEVDSASGSGALYPAPFSYPSSLYLGNSKITGPKRRAQSNQTSGQIPLCQAGGLCVILASCCHCTLSEVGVISDSHIWDWDSVEAVATGLQGHGFGPPLLNSPGPDAETEPGAST